MKLRNALVVVFVAIMLVSCGSAERSAHRAKTRSANAQTKIAQERLKLVDQYKKCVEDAGEDVNRIEACDSFLKAAESLQ